MLPFVVALLVVLALTSPTLAGSTTAPARSDVASVDTLLDALGDVRLGDGVMGIGFGVSPLGPWPSVSPSPPTVQPGALAPRDQLIDPGTAISFDLKLSWPSVVDVTSRSPVEPYVTLGPALLLPEPNVSRAGPVADRSVSFGVRAGAGLTWQLDQNATLFGEYRFTRSRLETLLPFSGRGMNDVGEFDVLYGMRFRF